MLRNQVTIAYGTQDIKVTVPEENLLAVTDVNNVLPADENHCIQEAFLHPVESPTLQDFLDNSRRLLVVVNDAARPTPTGKILMNCRRFIDFQKSTFIIATGTHRRPSNKEMHSIFDQVFDLVQNRMFVHDARDASSCVVIGTTSRGTTVEVNRLVLESDAILLIGSVEPHYFAGYTGGRKGLIPGLTSYQTTAMNHQLAMSPYAAPLRLVGNPVHEDLCEAMSYLSEKKIFSLMVVLDRHQQIYEAAGGDWNESLLALVPPCNEVYAVPVPHKADIVVTVASFPLDIDLYQSQKALEHGRLALKDDGIIILVSKCRDGLGNDAFIKLLAAHNNPRSAMESIRNMHELGSHKAFRLAQLCGLHEVWSVTDIQDTIIKQIFFKPYHDLQQAIDDALRIKGLDAEVLFLTQGCVSVPIVEHERKQLFQES